MVRAGRGILPGAILYPPSLIFEYPLKTQKKTSEQVIGFANKVKSSDGIIIVTPEYNGDYPASLKNILDLLYYEWHGKPISVCTISTGSFGGTQALVSLQFTLWKLGNGQLLICFVFQMCQKHLTTWEMH